jgi:hypothetical protein
VHAAKSALKSLPKTLISNEWVQLALEEDSEDQLALDTEAFILSESVKEHLLYQHVVQFVDKYAQWKIIHSKKPTERKMLSSLADWERRIAVIRCPCS